jgi:hypothetical protein
MINKTHCVYVTEYYLASKMNKILVYAALWLNLENVMLSEKN